LREPLFLGKGEDLSPPLGAGRGGERREKLFLVSAPFFFFAQNLLLDDHLPPFFPLSRESCPVFVRRASLAKEEACPVWWFLFSGDKPAIFFSVDHKESSPSCSDFPFFFRPVLRRSRFDHGVAFPFPREGANFSLPNGLLFPLEREGLLCHSPVTGREGKDALSALPPPGESRKRTSFSAKRYPSRRFFNPLFGVEKSIVLLPGEDLFPPPLRRRETKRQRIFLARDSPPFFGKRKI